MGSGKQMAGVFLVLVMVFLVACTPKAPTEASRQSPVLAQPAKAAAPAAPARPTKAAWEIEWERVQEEAKREGQLSLAISAGDLARRGMGEGFRKAYGVSTEVVNAPSPQLIAKMLAERKAGVYLWDVVLFGSSGILNTLKPPAALDPLESSLILPDLTEPDLVAKTWLDGKLPWVDRDRTILVPLKFPDPVVAINTNLVKPGEIKTYRDLLDPKWRGKITMSDPTVGGAGLSNFLPIFVVGGMGGGMDFLRELANAKPLIMRDERLQTEWLAQGKVAIVIGSSTRNIVVFKQVGAPIDDIFIDEATTLGGSNSALSAINKPPHPNARKLFINWYLSKDGQTVISKALLGQSARLDVPTDFLSPDSLRKPVAKYYIKDLEENLLKRAEVEKVAKELFGPLIK